MFFVFVFKHSCLQYTYNDLMYIFVKLVTVILLETSNRSYTREPTANTSGCPVIVIILRKLKLSTFPSNVVME